ncbi:hypothetical protein MPK67_gp296 [Erwinia phage pEa_SNUABM_32]|uniref:Uncharacterized protein n=1 Tax=Erwinia phage pEa_SNUABM_32 TaxID=2869555 RepID=A0AAE7XLB5_9CAUD|nr:hypothetical protein MPK67_gp296 [Erwinia phage pEa_SNUABM_32]QZE57169.1 hypothetical protein pEaSNUABM32_00296 [Erwinia phage pEa_SNUABM_32]
MTEQTEITVVARRLFEKGSVEVRDALRAIANTVLAPSLALQYEDSVPSVEATYRILDEITFSGDGTLLLPADDIYAFDNLLNKKWRGTFFNAVSNMALTMWCTDPRTAGKGFWPKQNNECCELITRSLIWVIAQHGLENLLIKDSPVVSHTRLPQFIIALQTEGKDEGYARHFSLYNPHADTGSISTNNMWSDEYRAEFERKLVEGRPAEYDSVRHMDFDTLADLCERLNLIGPNATPRGCTCDEDEFDCECDCDEVMTREDFDNDDDELRDVFYQKYGHPDDGVDYDEAEWITGTSLMEVEIDLPTVRLPVPDIPKSQHPHMKKQKKAMPKAPRKQVILTHAQQIWHELDSKHEFGDRRFAITLVSRHTCGINRAVATNREALAIAYAISSLESK